MFNEHNIKLSHNEFVNLIHYQFFFTSIQFYHKIKTKAQRILEIPFFQNFPYYSLQRYFHFSINI